MTTTTPENSPTNSVGDISPPSQTINNSPSIPKPTSPYGSILSLPTIYSILKRLNTKIDHSKTIFGPNSLVNNFTHIGLVGLVIFLFKVRHLFQNNSSLSKKSYISRTDSHMSISKESTSTSGASQPINNPLTLSLPLSTTTPSVNIPPVVSTNDSNNSPNSATSNPSDNPPDKTESSPPPLEILSIRIARFIFQTLLKLLNHLFNTSINATLPQWLTNFLGSWVKIPFPIMFQLTLPFPSSLRASLTFTISANWGVKVKYALQKYNTQTLF